MPVEEILEIDWGHPMFYFATIMLGCCVGSYLNAVIYRLPRGLSTSDPKRSFCPICKEPIPFYRNIPLVTWVIQRGKCAECDAPIAVRYLLVELLTGLVWVGCWWMFAVQHVPNDLNFAAPIWYPAALAVFFIIMSTIAIVITFIDIEHLIIPIQLSVGGAVVALIGAALLPWHLGASDWMSGLQASLTGGVVGYGALWAVVLLGKFLFGKRKVVLEEAIPWSIREADEDSSDPNENVSLVLDKEDNFWHDLFFRKSDKLYMNEVSDLELNGEKCDESQIVITQDAVYIGDDEIALADLESLSGKVKNLVIPREAMGMGDVHLLGVIGLCLGVQSLLMVILAACGFGILIHLLARAGFGKQMPFGPSLILGAALWLICGPELVEAYMNWVRDTISLGS